MKPGLCSSLRNLKFGDLYEPDTMHPFSIVNCYYRIIANAMRAELESVAAAFVRTSQRGFHGGRLITHNILDMDFAQLCQMTGCSKAAFILVDFKAASPKALHDYIWQFLLHIGLPELVVRLQQRLYTNNPHTLVA